jgi:hypothetical protein
MYIGRDVAVPTLPEKTPTSLELVLTMTGTRTPALTGPAFPKETEKILGLRGV